MDEVVVGLQQAEAKVNALMVEQMEALASSCPDEVIVELITVRDKLERLVEVMVRCMNLTAAGWTPDAPPPTLH